MSKYLAKGTEILPDPLLCSFRVQTANKDLLHWFFLHRHCSLGVDLPSV